MDTKVPAIKKTELVITALDYAHKHNLDIKRKDDVEKIIKAIDPMNINEDDVEELMKLLQNADQFIRADVVKKRKAS